MWLNHYAKVSETLLWCIHCQKCVCDIDTSFTLFYSCEPEVVKQLMYIIACKIDRILYLWIMDYGYSVYCLEMILIVILGFRLLNVDSEELWPQ